MSPFISTSGSYSYVDPKQKVRTVEYTADANGFHPLLTNFEDTQAVPVDSEAVSLAKQKHYALYERIANSHAQGVPANAPKVSIQPAVKLSEFLKHNYCHRFISDRMTGVG